MRINKYIALCGVSSRRKAEEFVLNGNVEINGQIIKNLATVVDEKKDVVTINGQKILPAEDYVYFILNKPKGYVCTMSDDRNRKSILDLTTQIDRRIFPIGRLDYDSEGLLFLTNDGELSFKITHPKFRVEKKYIVKVEGIIKESELAVLRAGVVVDKIRYSKCKVTLLETIDNISRLEVVLTEGKNREIRNMFKAINKEVVFLKRIEIAGIKLGGLKRGEIRKLKDFEIEHLKSLFQTQNQIKIKNKL